MIRLRRLAITALVGLPLLAGGFLWLRDSSLVEVRRVAVTGTGGGDGRAIAGALRAATSDMTTLHVRMDELRAAVRPYPIVKDLRVASDPPHRLRIEVVEYEPVAEVMADGRPVPVAADGTLLTDRAAGPDLPTVPVSGPVATRRLTDPGALSVIALLGAAPAVLRPLVDDVRRDGDGLHVGLRSGPRIDFGAPVRLEAKWAAAARVLSDGRAAGASYLDVSAPQRPVAGQFADDGTGPVPPASPSPPTT